MLEGGKALVAGPLKKTVIFLRLPQQGQTVHRREVND